VYLILCSAVDEITELGGGSGAAGLTRDPAPIRTIRTAVPGHRRGGFDDHQGPGPVGPHRTQGDPEQAVGREEPGTAAAVCPGGELVAQGEIIQSQRRSRARQGAKPPDGELEEEKHRRTM